MSTRINNILELCFCVRMSSDTGLLSYTHATWLFVRYSKCHQTSRSVPFSRTGRQGLAGAHPGLTAHPFSYARTTVLLGSRPRKTPFALPRRELGRLERTHGEHLRHLQGLENNLRHLQDPQYGLRGGWVPLERQESPLKVEAARGPGSAVIFCSEWHFGLASTQLT